MSETQVTSIDDRSNRHRMKVHTRRKVVEKNILRPFEMFYKKRFKKKNCTTSQYCTVSFKVDTHHLQAFSNRDPLPIMKHEVFHNPQTFRNGLSKRCSTSPSKQGYHPQGYYPQGYYPQGYYPQGYTPTLVSLPRISNTCAHMRLVKCNTTICPRFS